MWKMNFVDKRSMGCKDFGEDSPSAIDKRN
jgi:hypothetical protein